MRPCGLLHGTRGVGAGGRARILVVVGDAGGGVEGVQAYCLRADEHALREDGGLSDQILPDTAEPAKEAVGESGGGSPQVRPLPGQATPSPLPPPPSRVPPARAGAHLHSIVREWVCLALLAEHIEGAVEAGDNEELVYFEALRRLHRRRLRRLRLRRRRRFGTLGQRPLLVLVLVLALVLVLVLALLVLISWRPIGPRAELRAQFLRGQ